MRRPVPFPAVAAAAYVALAAQAASGWTPSWTLCPVKLLTGRDCPGCSLGHALIAAMRGDLAASWRLHPLGPPLLALWTTWLAWGALNLVRSRPFSAGFIPALRRPAFTWAALAAVLTVYVLRAV